MWSKQIVTLLLPFSLLIASALILLPYKNLLVLIKIDIIARQVVSQETFHKFPSFNLSLCKKIAFSDPSFPKFKKYYHERHLNTSTLPLVYAGRFWSHLTIATYTATYFIEAVNVFYVKNGFVGPHRLIASNYTNFFDVTNTTINLNRNKLKDVKTTHGYRYVLTAVTDCGHFFAHILTDIFGPLMFLDPKIWDLKPVLVIQSGSAIDMKEYLNIIGYPNIQIIILNNEIIYGENLYVVSGYSQLCTSGFYSLPILQKYMFQYYKLDNIKPDKYGYMNKRPGRRHFTNLNKLIKTIEENYNISFIELKVNEPSRVEFARLFSSLKICVAPGGSIGFNCILMQNGTGTLALSADQMDMHQMHFTVNTHNWHVSVLHPNMHHWYGSGEANITRCMYAYNVLNYAIEHQKWPLGHHLFSPINETAYRESVGIPPDFTLKPIGVINKLYEEYIKDPNIPN